MRPSADLQPRQQDISDGALLSLARNLRQRQRGARGEDEDHDHEHGKHEAKALHRGHGREDVGDKGEGGRGAGGERRAARPLERVCQPRVEAKVARCMAEIVSSEDALCTVHRNGYTCNSAASTTSCALTPHLHL